MILVIFFGWLCGLALGLTGGGGSILAVPALVYGIGMSFHQAVAISLLVVGLTALVGFLPKLKGGEVELSAGVILAVMGMLFAPVGSYVGVFIDDKNLMLIFSILMISIGAWSWVKSKYILQKKSVKSQACQYLPSGKLHLTVKCKFVLALSGVFTGFLTGLFGVGGGFLIVPALVFAAKMPIKKAITTSLLIIFLVSSSGFISHIKGTTLNWSVAGLFILGSVVGIIIATKMKNLINERVLQKIFALFLVVLGVLLVYKA